MSDAILDLALRTASTPAVGLDLDKHLTETCSTLVRTLRVTAAVVVVLEPAGAHGSDGAAVLIGQSQLGASVGPVANALRSGRPMLTPDLLRVGPPALAAAASDCGLVDLGCPTALRPQPAGRRHSAARRAGLVDRIRPPRPARAAGRRAGRPARQRRRARPRDGTATPPDAGSAISAALPPRPRPKQPDCSGCPHPARARPPFHRVTARSRSVTQGSEQGR